MHMKSLFPIPAMCEYMILVCPTEEVKAEVKKMKVGFFRKHGSYSGQNSAAHINLFTFFLSEDCENKLMKRIKQTASSVNGFDSFLSGFGFDAVENNFYIEILDKMPLINLRNKLRMALFHEFVSLKFLQNNYQPQVIVGKHLSSLQILSAIREYGEQAYTNNFRVGSITLLKRYAPFKSWEVTEQILLNASEGAMVDL